ncbi:MAG: hypothetical protein EOP87_06750 [Verrucomicrobiaceae bacterium]|nr:MAG: hypothetical protein EOP87_06750 [Verrucomicrobiaceae bacterium]
MREVSGEDFGEPGLALSQRGKGRLLMPVIFSPAGSAVYGISDDLVAAEPGTAIGPYTSFPVCIPVFGKFTGQQLQHSGDLAAGVLRLGQEAEQSRKPGRIHLHGGKQLFPNHGGGLGSFIGFIETAPIGEVPYRHRFIRRWSGMMPGRERLACLDTSVQDVGPAIVILTVSVEGKIVDSLRKWSQRFRFFSLDAQPRENFILSRKRKWRRA